MASKRCLGKALTKKSITFWPFETEKNLEMASSEPDQAAERGELQLKLSQCVMGALTANLVYLGDKCVAKEALAAQQEAGQPSLPSAVPWLSRIACSPRPL